MLQPEMDVTLFIQFSNETFQWRLDEMIKCKKPGCEHIGLSFLVVFARSILDGLLYTIVKLIWKLIQSRIVPNLVLVDIFLVTGTVKLKCVLLLVMFQLNLFGIISTAQVESLLQYFPVFDKLRKEFFIGEMIWNFADFMTQQGELKPGADPESVKRGS